MNIEEVLTRPDYPIPRDISTLGRGNLRRFVIAVKERGGLWPPQFAKALHEARHAYDQGTHIMCQGKHSDGWVVQYSIPRTRTLRNPKPYFIKRAV